MGLTQSVSGLIYFELFDDPSVWDYWGGDAQNPGVAGYAGGNDCGAVYPLPAAGGPFPQLMSMCGKMINVGTGANRVIHIFDYQNGYIINCIPIIFLGPDRTPPPTWPAFLSTPITPAAAQGDGWIHRTAPVPATFTGQQYIGFGYSILMAEGGTFDLPGNPTSEYDVSHLLVCTSDVITISGLIAGQSVQLYLEAGNILVGTGTVAANATNCTINVAAQVCPTRMYAIVYTPTGGLVEQTDAFTMCGGDTWTWGANAGSIGVVADNLVIYRQGSPGSPQLANLTINLKTTAGGPAVNAPVYFTTNIGTLSKVYDVTDANGNITLTFTCGVCGLAVVQAQYLGSAGTVAASAYCSVHVFQNPEVPDPLQAFQFYVEGIQYDYVSGTYTIPADNVVGSFSVVMETWDPTITIYGIVDIYHWGILEFRGQLQTPKMNLSTAPQISIGGPDISTLLDARTVPLKIYSAQTLSFIINDLITSFPSGITVGTIAPYAPLISGTISALSLRAAIQKICTLIGWVYRINPNNTIDLAASFGSGLSAAVFEEGINVLDAAWEAQYADVLNSAVVTVASASGTPVTAVAQDQTSIQQIGLHEAPVLDMSTNVAAVASLIAVTTVQDAGETGGQAGHAINSAPSGNQQSGKSGSGGVGSSGAGGSSSGGGGAEASGGMH
jgi:hypothetical protein